jgi:signal transduction histidine kinase
MTALDRILLLVISDAAMVQQLIGGLLRDGARYQIPIATSLAQARARLRRVVPLAILLDESAVATEADPTATALEAAVRELAGAAPLVLVVTPERLGELEPLAPLVREGHLDIVPRHGDFLPLVVGLLERHADRDTAETSPAERAAAPILKMPRPVAVGPAEGEMFESPEFGEILRHEVNNPLTGILGNAELLLSRRDRLPLAAVQRLETIAALAVRLRETIRRLSNAWEENHHRTRSA